MRGRVMLEVRNLRKDFASGRDRVVALKGISFTVARGEFFTLLGPSGCGKSTTMRCIAGLETVDSGEIYLDGELVASSSTFVPPSERDVGMVFQSYAIWPHMTVIENVMFPLRYRRNSSASGGTRMERRERALQALKLVQLDELADRPAPLLSGGQQQRVALARSLVGEPKLLLLDEPLSNLDAKLREDMRVEIQELTTRLGITSVYVTHDQSEALSMSDRISVMMAGESLQIGTPREVYLRPVSKEVASFIGTVNSLAGELIDRNSGYAAVRTSSGVVIRCRLARDDEKGTSGSVTVVVRPEFLVVHRKGQADQHAAGPRAVFDASYPGQQPNMIHGTVSRLRFMGDHIDCYCETPDGLLRATLPPDSEILAGEDVLVCFDADRCVVPQYDS